MHPVRPIRPVGPVRVSVDETVNAMVVQVRPVFHFQETCRNVSWNIILTAQPPVDIHFIVFTRFLIKLLLLAKQTNKPFEIC